MLCFNIEIMANVNQFFLNEFIYFIREMKIKPHKGIKLRNSTIPLFAYADDIVLMDESQNGVKRLCERLNDAIQKVGLQINEQKTEYMVIGRQNWMNHVLEVDNFKFRE